MLSMQAGIFRSDYFPLHAAFTFLEYRSFFDNAQTEEKNANKKTKSVLSQVSRHKSV